MIVGYIVVAIAKTRRTRERKYEALSYGTDQEPAPNELLMRGCATIFKTHEAAHAAMKRSISPALLWLQKHDLAVIEVYAAPDG